MAYDAILYGSIDCFCTPSFGDWRRLWAQNSAVITALPSRAERALIFRELFSIEEGSARIQVIHFGGAFKSFSASWDNWRNEFDGLLRRLYWNTARVHLEDEQLGHLDCRWIAKDESWRLALQEPPIPIAEWYFTCKIAEE